MNTLILKNSGGRANQATRNKKDNSNESDKKANRKKVLRRACTSDTEINDIDDDDVIEKALKRSATMGHQRKLIPLVNYVNSDVIPSKKIRKTPTHGPIEIVNLKSVTPESTKSTKSSKQESLKTEVDNKAKKPKNENDNQKI